MVVGMMSGMIFPFGGEEGRGSEGDRWSEIFDLGVERVCGWSGSWSSFWDLLVQLPSSPSSALYLSHSPLLLVYLY